jgi:hypothetical protein
MIVNHETIRTFPAAGALVALVGALALMAGAALLVDARLASDQPAQSAAFQRLVGGFGFGPALDLSVCPFAFDPRVEDHCGFDDGPLPGGSAMCPCHTASVFFYPSLRPTIEGPPEAERHAHPP